MPIFGKGSDAAFYAIFEAQADAACRAAEVFQSLSKSFAQVQECALRVKRIEHEADDLTHQIINKIDGTFITPLDKEDLHRLANILDDVVDTIETTVSRLVIYDIKEPHPALEGMLAVLVEVTAVTRQAVGCLRNMKERKALQEALLIIHTIEHKGDDLFREVLTNLFRTPHPDPLYVMKWKEVYDRIERAIDNCENVADALESIMVKYA